ncbi:MAG: DUF4012 domain-containing protein [Candidatus Harrisonbacteria bacterium]|nr:DUF4012 domain-containing protein [Candidatus Harrisonbacteria bacterium]
MVVLCYFYIMNPKKNISKLIADIRPPCQPIAIPEETAWEQTRAELAAELPPPPPKIKFQQKTLRKTIPYLKITFAALALTTGIYAAAVIDFKETAIKSFSVVYQEAHKIKAALIKFKPDEIISSLKLTELEIKSVKEKAEVIGLPEASSLLGNFISKLKPVRGTIENLSIASERARTIAENLNSILKSSSSLITNNRGQELIKILKQISSDLTLLGNLGPEFKNQVTSLSSLTPELSSLSGLLEKNYIPLSLNIYRTRDFLDGLIALLEYPGDKHILLIFQNQTEMRPAGGFIGSYGDLTINRGNLKDVKVDDIYNADRQLNLKLIPPLELRGITKTWGARDANWFFDFPTSARKVTELLEQADLHYLNGIRFDGAIAINTKVLGTLIDSAGPIRLANYNLTLNRQNFLQELQYEVEAGRDKKPGQNPKKILSALTPLLLEKLNNLSETQKDVLVEKIKNHFLEKDIMIYFKDFDLQNFVENLGVAGEVAHLPRNFSGDYLAIVNSNIAAGKTDAFIDQKIKLQSQISAEGKIINDLVISRMHNGQNEKDWWYKVNNKNYLKILVPEKSKLAYVQGNDPPPAVNAADYSSYEYDADLQAVEKTAVFIDKFKTQVEREFGKVSFGTWSNTPAGKTKNLKISYENGVKLSVRSGMPYEFIFEKQSGSDSMLDYSVTAPPGYHWKESGKEIFEYSTKELKTREIIKLTLTNS